MVQPPQPGEGQGAHPEPTPTPVPDPEPPQPIPPPEPVPVPEPPHRAAHRPPIDFIDAPPLDSAMEYPPVGAYPGEPGHPTSPGEPGQAAAPGRPGQPAAADTPTEQLQAVQMQQTAQFQLSAQLEQTPEPQPRLQPTQLQQAQLQPEAPLEQAPLQRAQLQQAQVTETWQQPAPAEPFHAQHEKTGEWQTHPPDHLAWEHSPPAEVEAQTEPAQNEPAQNEPAQNEPVWAGNGPPTWQTQLTAAEPGKRRGGLWVSLALTVTLLLCGGGAVSAYFLISNADTGKGAPDPATAVNRFMTAVYTQQDASAADDLVCRDARDPDRLAARVTQVKDYANAYDGPTFRWNEPAVSAQTDEKATVKVQLTLATADEKTAQQTLTFTAVHKTGWLVCDVAG